MPEVKVVVFGRGNGESILVELEKNNWMVVDSFINPHTKKPASISYLESLGLVPSEVLNTIIITHFHEDHIKGMSSIIEHAHPTAKVCMPDALTTHEALKYYTSLNILNGYDDKSMTSEICKIFEYMCKANRTIVRLNQDKLIFNSISHTVTALSPSDYDSQMAQTLFTSEIIKSAIPLSARKQSPNHFCVALNIQNLAANKSILLGADLEITTDKRGGWDAAISTLMAPKRNSIDLFKVPHHGSETAFHKYTWDNFISSDVVALITTFGSSSLPREEYINKFKEYTNHVLCTTRPKYNYKSIINHKAQKIINKKTPSVSILDVMPKLSFGYIASIHSSKKTSYELYGDAVQL